MNLWKQLDTIDHDTCGTGMETVRVVIEIPKGSTLKYEYEASGGYLRVVREVEKKYRCPFNYGMIPQTETGKGNPLDAIVIYDQPISAGTVINCKVYGAIRTVDEGKEDDKIICLPYFKLETEVDTDKIKYYLGHYKHQLQNETFIGRVCGCKEAEEIINNSIKKFKERHL